MKNTMTNHPMVGGILSGHVGEKSVNIFFRPMEKNAVKIKALQCAS
jgi:hypothetical protein